MKRVQSMSLEDLIKTRAEVDAAIELRAMQERRLLIAALERMGTRSGAVLRSGRKHPLKGTKLPPLYRNPENFGETWAGRGKRPNWLVAALKRGRRLDSFAIK